MITTDFTVTFATPVATPEGALEMAKYIAAADSVAVVEDNSGKSAGSAQDNIYRFFLGLTLPVLVHNREIVLETLVTLGADRGPRLARLIANNVYEGGTAMFWQEVREEVLAKAI